MHQTEEMELHGDVQYDLTLNLDWRQKETQYIRHINLQTNRKNNERDREQDISTHPCSPHTNVRCDSWHPVLDKGLSHPREVSGYVCSTQRQR